MTISVDVFEAATREGIQLAPTDGLAILQRALGVKSTNCLTPYCVYQVQTPHQTSTYATSDHLLDLIGSCDEFTIGIETNTQHLIIERTKGSTHQYLTVAPLTLAQH